MVREGSGVCCSVCDGRVAAPQFNGQPKIGRRSLNSSDDGINASVVQRRAGSPEHRLGLITFSRRNVSCGSCVQGRQEVCGYWRCRSLCVRYAQDGQGCERMEKVALGSQDHSLTSSLEEWRQHFHRLRVPIVAY